MFINSTLYCAGFAYELEIDSKKAEMQSPRGGFELPNGIIATSISLEKTLRMGVENCFSETALIDVSSCVATQQKQFLLFNIFDVRGLFSIAVCGVTGIAVLLLRISCTPIVLFEIISFKLTKLSGAILKNLSPHFFEGLGSSVESRIILMVHSASKC